MSRNAWRNIFALLAACLLVCATAVRAQQNPNDQTPSASQSPNAPNQPAGTTRSAPPQEVSNQHGSANPKTESQEQGGEFWTAKLTDWLLAAFTLALVFFTARLYQATAGLVGATNKLWEAGERQLTHLEKAAAQQSVDMQAAVLQAKRSADAAYESLEVTRSNREADMRAYISHSGFKVIWGKPDGKRIDIIQFTPQLQNTGRSPAHLDIAWRAGQFSQSSDPPRFVKQSEIRSDATIGSGNIGWGSPIQITWEDYENITSGRTKFYIWFRTEYSDIFNKSHFTESCWEAVPWSIVPREAEIDLSKTETFRFRNVGPQNAQD